MNSRDLNQLFNSLSHDKIPNYQNQKPISL